jgi:hypothetical protein
MKPIWSNPKQIASKSSSLFNQCANAFGARNGSAADSLQFFNYQRDIAGRLAA